MDESQPAATPICEIRRRARGAGPSATGPARDRVSNPFPRRRPGLRYPGSAMPMAFARVFFAYALRHPISEATL